MHSNLQSFYFLMRRPPPPSRSCSRTARTTTSGRSGGPSWSTAASTPWRRVDSRCCACRRPGRLAVPPGVDLDSLIAGGLFYRDVIAPPRAPRAGKRMIPQPGGTQILFYDSVSSTDPCSPLNPAVDCFPAQANHPGAPLWDAPSVCGRMDLLLSRVIFDHISGGSGTALQVPHHRRR